MWKICRKPGCSVPVSWGFTLNVSFESVLISRMGLPPLNAISTLAIITKYRLPNNSGLGIFTVWDLSETVRAQRYWVFWNILELQMSSSGCWDQENTMIHQSILVWLNFLRQEAHFTLEECSKANTKPSPIAVYWINPVKMIPMESHWC